MYKIGELLEFISDVDDFIELMAIYHANFETLKDYTILVFDDNITKTINEKPPLDITNKLKELKVVSTFNESVCVLNNEIYCNLINNIKVDFGYKYCFNLDVNLMNVLVDFHNGKNKLDSMKKICDLNLFYNDTTCYPYIIENASKLSNSKTEKCVIDTLLIFNKFKNSSLRTFSTDYPFMEENYQDTKKMIDIMMNMQNEDVIFVKLQKNIYALLLKTAIVSFNRKFSVERKLIEIANFIQDLGILLERELVFCYWFLKNRNDVRIKNFFKYIHDNVKDIKEKINGMSWDLFHLRYSIEIMMAKDINNNSLCLNYIVTQDKGLSDLANAHPIKFFIHKKGGTIPHIIPKNCIQDVIEESDVLKIISNTEKRKKILICWI